MLLALEVSVKYWGAGGTDKSHLFRLVLLDTEIMATKHKNYAP
jgi:hypothetical protein